MGEAAGRASAAPSGEPATVPSMPSRSAGGGDRNSAAAKAERAEEHLVDLKRALDKWLGRHPYTLVTSEPAPSPSNRYAAEAKVWVNSVEPVPDKVGIVLGDLLGNLRAALDHCAWRAACRHLGREPSGTEKASRVAFPIEGSAERFEKHATVALVSDEARDLMRACQPFPSHRSTRARHLAVLKNLVNVDKHREIHTAVGVVVSDPGPEVVVEGARHLGTLPGDEVLVPGSLVATILLGPESLRPDSHFGVHAIPVEIRFGDEEDVTFTFISEMRKTVNRLVLEFAPFFRP